VSVADAHDRTTGGVQGGAALDRKAPDVDRHREHPTGAGTSAESTDGVLVAALRDRDEDAYLELLRRHTPLMLRVARSLVHSTEAAERFPGHVAALELAPYRVRLNAVAPAVPRTGMTSDVSDELLSDVPLRRIADPQEIADAVLWLARSDYATGTVVTVDGGYTAR
jgi:hypothetical protein